MTKLRGLTLAAFLGIKLLIVGCGNRNAEPTATTVTSPPSRPQTAESIGPDIADAARLLGQGDLLGAEKIAKTLLVESPLDVAANTVLASILAERGEYSSAIASLDELAQTDPVERDRVEAQAADLAFESGEVEDAINRFEKILDRSPTFDLARRRLAQLLNQHGYRFDANEHLRELAGQMPLSLDELRGLSYPMLPWVNVSEKPNIHDIEQIRRMGVLTAARALVSQGDVRECFELLSSSRNTNRTDFNQRNAAATAFRLWTIAAMQDFDALENAIASAPDSCQRYPEYWLAAGTLALHRRDTAAIGCFAEAIRREPNCLEAHDGMVQAAEHAGRTQWAELFKNRVRQVDRVQRLTRQIVTSRQVSQEDFAELVELAKDMGHPLESVLWQELLFSQLSPAAPQLRVLRDYKPNLLTRFPRGFNDSGLLCGIDMSGIAPADEWLAAIQLKHPARPIAHEATPTRPVNTPTRPVNAFTPAVATPLFRNVAAQVGAVFRYKNAAVPVSREFQIFQAYGSGVACFDFDLDGRVDLYLGQAASTPPNELSREPNALFRNLGERFVDIVAASGADDRRYTTGITSGDWNQDGFADLAIGNLGGNRLLVNQGDGTFRVQFVDPLWDKPEYTTSLAIADITGDGLPDIIEVNYLDDPAIFNPIQYDGEGKPVMLPGPLNFQPGLDRVFVALGNGSFESRRFGWFDGGTEKDNLASTGLGLLVTDIDGDGINDIFVANDLRANQLWVKELPNASEPVKFRDVAVARGVAYGNSGQPMACMGIAAADFDGNGKTDLHVTNFDDQWSNQYMQRDSGTFVDQIVPLGLDAASRKVVGFGAQALDYDNNTTSDLIVGNGHVEDFTARGKLFEMPTQLFANDGSRFTQVKVAGDDSYWLSNHLTRGLAKCDWNRDGRIDVVATDLKQEFALLENQTSTGNDWLQIELVGTEAEREPVGASVTIRVGQREFSQTAQTGDGYLSKNESVLHFGLGNVESRNDIESRNAGSEWGRHVDQITVRWPTQSGQPETEAGHSGVDIFENVRVNARILLIQNEKSVWYRVPE